MNHAANSSTTVILTCALIFGLAAREGERRKGTVILSEVAATAGRCAAAVVRRGAARGGEGHGRPGGGEWPRPARPL
ncbi:hypothetical protein GCM10010377_44200 [Streptomyces viridiviolaceus]|nr:hypothetical protein GCM10010377_44200 [Streptomyces viridiviolaceus]